MYRLVRKPHGKTFTNMPYKALLRKMETTDGVKVADYRDYVKSEIKDYSPDAPFLDDGYAKSNPDLSKSIINLRHNGSRGMYEYPQHPELFTGFFDVDYGNPDGTPRMWKMRDHMSMRARDIEPMFKTSMSQDQESPWSHRGFAEARTHMHREMKRHFKVFIGAREQTMARGGMVFGDAIKLRRQHRDQPFKQGEDAAIYGATRLTDLKKIPIDVEDFSTSGGTIIPISHATRGVSKVKDTSSHKFTFAVSSSHRAGFNHDDIKPVVFTRQAELPYADSYATMPFSAANSASLNLFDTDFEDNYATSAELMPTTRKKRSKFVIPFAENGTEMNGSFAAPRQGQGAKASMIDNFLGVSFEGTPSFVSDNSSGAIPTLGPSKVDHVEFDHEDVLAHTATRPPVKAPTNKLPAFDLSNPF